MRGAGPDIRSPDRIETFEHGRSDPRLAGYLMAGFGALVAAIAFGRPEFAALGAPFLAIAAMGLPRRNDMSLAGDLRVDAVRVLEGDEIRGEVRVEWNGTAEVEVVLTGIRGVEPVEPTPRIGWSLEAGSGPATLPFRVRAETWGAHELGAVWVRARRPGALVFREARVAGAPRIRVLPSPLRLDRLLQPAEPRAVAGLHVSRLRGRGTDFAEMRPYQPGDRLRDLSWGTSARLGEPWVVVHHPERTGTLLLILDAYFARERSGAEALARAARAAWAVASVHLRAQDRVGILTQGLTTAWLPPRGGRRARWMLLDELLSVGSAVEDRLRRRRMSGRVAIPADALVVGVTNLRTRSFARTLLHHRRTGHSTGALVIDTLDLWPAAKDGVDRAVRRLWEARREAERAALERGGVPTALVSPTEGVAPAVSALRRRMAGPGRGRPPARYAGAAGTGGGP